VFLAMGGIALGKAVVSSGLLTTMDDGVRGLVDGLQLYEIVLVLSVVVLVSRSCDYLVNSADSSFHRSFQRLSVTPLQVFF
jgi:hypothetical protein